MAKATTKKTTKEKVEEIKAEVEAVMETVEEVLEDNEETTEIAPEQEQKEETVNDSEKKLYYRGALITSEIEDRMISGHMYKAFTTELKETLMLSQGEFDADVIAK